MRTMDSAQEFFFVDGAGSQCGPVTAATLKEYWAGGYVNDTTYAFAVDGSTANWTPIAQLAELHTFCTSATPPPPPIPPVPPPLPTAASTTPPPADDGNNALLAGIRNFKKEGSLRSVKADESPPAASGGGGSGDLMAQIAGGVKLRSAKESSERVPAPAPAAGMGGMMAQIAGGVKLRKTSTKVREEVGGVVDTPAAASDAARGGALRKASTRAAAATPPAEADEWAEAAPSPPPMPAPTPKVAAEDVEIKSLTSWRTRTTAEGATYYHNEDTQEVCWEKPDELKTAAERSAEGAYNWLPSETEGFEAYRVVQAPATDGSFIGESTGADGKVNRRRVSAKEAKRACALTPSHLERAPPHDLVMLPAVNEPMILHALRQVSRRRRHHHLHHLHHCRHHLHRPLRQRFLNDEIYTAVGSILVSVNPFKPLPLYTPSVVHKYSHRGSTELPPHVYALADNAYRGILFDGKDQSLIVSGESGAGKTEATKLSLAYLAAVAGSASGVEQKVLLAILTHTTPLPASSRVSHILPPTSHEGAARQPDPRGLRQREDGAQQQLVALRQADRRQLRPRLADLVLAHPQLLVGEVEARRAGAPRPAFRPHHSSHAAPHSDLTTHPSTLTTHPPRRAGAGRAQLPLLLPAVRRRRRRRVRPPLARPAVVLRAARVVWVRRH